MTKKMILLNASPRKNKNTAHVQSVRDNLAEGFAGCV